MMITLQYLRAVAALLVAYFHAVVTPRFAESLPHAAMAFGAVGVDIFFLISGFIMTYTVASRPIPSAEFFARRLMRVVPLYWIATLTMFFMPLVSNTVAAGHPMSGTHLVTSLLFLPWPHPLDSAQLYPVYPPGWTLNYEMFFYVLFSLALVIKRLSTAIAVVLSVLSGLVILGVVFRPAGIAGFYTSQLLLEFCFGIAIAILVRSGFSLPQPAAFAAIVIAISMLLLFPIYRYSDDIRIITGGVPSALLVAGLVSLETQRRVVELPLLKLLGDASYAIYLTHGFTIGFAYVFWRRAGLPAPSAGLSAVIFVTLSFVASAAIGTAAYQLLERPMLRTLKESWKTMSAKVRETSTATRGSPVD